MSNNIIPIKMSQTKQFKLKPIYNATDIVSRAFDTQEDILNCFEEVKTRHHMVSPENMRNGKINAIKEYRQLTMSGLVEAKEFIEHCIANNWTIQYLS